jgi:hypothetical protein
MGDMMATIRARSRGRSHIRIFAFAALLVVGIVLPVGAAGPLSTLQFLVSRDGAGIGQHDIKFSRRGDDLVVDIAVDIEVKFLFSTIFQFAHKTREIWRNDPQ